MVNNIGYVFWCALCGLFALRVVLIWLNAVCLYLHAAWVFFGWWLFVICLGL